LLYIPLAIFNFVTAVTVMEITSNLLKLLPNGIVGTIGVVEVLLFDAALGYTIALLEIAITEEIMVPEEPDW
ncbi:MAG: hypothetical protein ACPLXS_01250, partial [Candidatus Micrarchaeales archaeon]